MENYKKFCLNLYQQKFDNNITKGQKPTDAQRNAIKNACIETIKEYPLVEPSDIWKQIYIAHIYNKSGITDIDTIKSIVSSEQSWNKSSGHAFEEILKDIGNLYLSEHNIQLLLQKDLTALLKIGEINNKAPDIKWLEEKISEKIFDLFLIVLKEEKKYVFGCVQSKTSVRDRVARDREPSIKAMDKFFMSIAIVLNGDFLRLPKFKNMVNGNSTEYEINGWHGLYILTNEEIDKDRIHTMGLDMQKLVNHCVKGANYWLTQRQWLNHSWDPNK